MATTVPGWGTGQVRLVLFDLDDTLYPEHAFVDGGFRAAAAFLAPVLGCTAAELVERLWALHTSEGRGRLFDTLLAEHGVDDPDLLLACILAYRAHTVSITPFPGVEDALNALCKAGVRLGIVSDGMSAVQRRKLAGLGAIGGLFEVVVMTDELGREYAKPSPVPFRVACRVASIAPREAVYVANDARKDFAGARAAGLRTVHLGDAPDEGGGRAPAAGVEADVVVGSFGSLVTLLTGAPNLHGEPDPASGAPR